VEEVSARMKWIYVRKALSHTLTIYGAFLVLTFLATIALDMAGSGSFVIALGPVEFYRFVKDDGGFQGSLAGGGFWLAVVLGLITPMLQQLLRREDPQT